MKVLPVTVGRAVHVHGHIANAKLENGLMSVSFNLGTKRYLTVYECKKYLENISSFIPTSNNN